MSLRRLNTLTMYNILPFNFGTDHAAWCRMWEAHPDMRETLIGSNPHEWTAEVINQVNKTASEEMDLYDRLVALGDEEFTAEVARLAALQKPETIDE